MTTARLPTTPSQTAGPFLSIGLDWGTDGADVVPEGTPGAVRIHGIVYDGAASPVTDALVETWQAAPDGRFDHPDDPSGRTDFRGVGRCLTHPDGSYAIRTLKPGAVPGPDGNPQAPHVNVSVFSRGLLNRVVTRVYFPEDATAHATDHVLSVVPRTRRNTLIAAADATDYRFDIRLQGDGETIFFDV